MCCDYQRNLFKLNWESILPFFSSYCLFFSMSSLTDLSSSSSTPNKRGSRSVCRLSEFVCKGGKCISADKFCDGVDDCGDGSPSSDEPRFCTRKYIFFCFSLFLFILYSKIHSFYLVASAEEKVDK